MNSNRPVRLSSVARFLGLALYFVFLAFPIYWLVITSFKSAGDLFALPIKYYPEQPTLINYAKTFEKTMIPQYFLNSLYVSSAAALITSLVAILGGYSMARFHFRGKQPTLLLFLATQMMPIVLLIVPLFILFKTLRLIDTLYSLMLVYTVFNIPFCTVMLRGFFEGIPKEIEDCAMVDGCTRMMALFLVTLPNVLPGLVATLLFAFVAAWNELLFGLMFLNTMERYTLPVGLSLYVGKYEVNWGMISAGATLGLIPALVIFGFVQRYMVKGLTVGAVKG